MKLTVLPLILESDKKWNDIHAWNVLNCKSKVTHKLKKKSRVPDAARLFAARISVVMPS